MMLTRLTNVTITRSAVHVLHEKAFWDEITYPLFQNLRHVNVEHNDERAVVETCFQLLSHSAVLELLTSERYGVGVHLVKPYINGKVIKSEKNMVDVVLEDSRVIKKVDAKFLLHTGVKRAQKDFEFEKVELKLFQSHNRRSHISKYFPTIV